MPAKEYTRDVGVRRPQWNSFYFGRGNSLGKMLYENLCNKLSLNKMTDIN